MSPPDPINLDAYRRQRAAPRDVAWLVWRSTLLHGPIRLIARVLQVRVEDVRAALMHVEDFNRSPDAEADT